MNKKILFAAAIAPMAILASCSDNEVATENVVFPIPAETATEVAEAAKEVTPLAVYLTDQKGNRVENLGGDFGIYNLHIEGAEAWIIKSNKAFVSVLNNKGTGDAVIPVYVATCWGNYRDAILSVKTLDLDAPATRGTSEMVEDTQIGINQAPAYGYTYFSRFGSNVGVGFAYNPLRSDDVLFAIGQPIFDIEGLLEEGLIYDDTNYTNTEEILIESSEAKLHEKLMVKGGINGSFAKGAFSGAISGSYGTNHNADSSNWISVMTKRSIIFQREMNYLNLAYSENQHFSVGFTHMADVLNKALTAAENNEQRMKALNDFFSHFGPFFIYRAQIGAQLDYTCTISKSVLSDSTDLAAAIKVKFEKEVVQPDSTATSKKDDSSDKANASEKEDAHPDLNEVIARFFAENSESLENGDGDKDGKDEDKAKKDSVKWSIGVDGDALYENYLSQIASKTSAKLDIKGGTNGVSILAGGGIIKAEDLEEWTKNITPNNAVLGNFLVAPIYHFFKEGTPAYIYLKEFAENGKLEGK